MPSLPSLLGPYRLDRKLGGGGFADVYLAFDTRRGHAVALKVLHPQHANSPEALRRFQREGEQMLKLRHQHIVAALEAGQVDGWHYIALEYLPRGSLADLLARQRPLDLVTAAQVIDQVATALEFVHPTLVHRDLKPRNILFSQDGLTKVADFGIARVSDQITLTGAGQILGTPQYMAPEQANPRLGPISPATDIWALGIILYEMLCGRPPFEAEEPTAVLYQVMHEAPPPATLLNPSLPKDVEKILAKALAKDPRRRYRRAGQMAAELQQLAQRDAAKAFVPPRPQHKPLLLGLGGILVVVAGLLWFLLRPLLLTGPALQIETATPLAVAVATEEPTRQHPNTSTIAPVIPTATIGAYQPATETPSPALVVAAATRPLISLPPPTAPAPAPAPIAPCPPDLHQPEPGMGLLLIENHIGEPLHIDHASTGQKWDIASKQGDTPGRLVLDLPPGRHVLIDNTPNGSGRITVEITPGSAFLSPIWYNALSEEILYPLDIPSSCPAGG